MANRQKLTQYVQYTQFTYEELLLHLRGLNCNSYEPPTPADWPRCMRLAHGRCSLQRSACLENIGQNDAVSQC